jgi:sec-independent protein translocase protein TatC
MSDIEPSKASPAVPAASPPAPGKPAETPSAKPPEPTSPAAAKAADKSKAAGDPEMEKGTMTFWEHLDELRSRMFKMALAFVIGGGVCWHFKEQILAIVAQPLADGWVGNTPVKLHFGSPAAMFLAYLKLSLMAGLTFSMPIIFYQIWAFVAPGLYSKEKRLALPFVFVSTALFVGGAYFGWVFAFPMAFQYLLGFGGQLPTLADTATPAASAMGPVASAVAPIAPVGSTVAPAVGAAMGITIEPTIMIGDYIDFVVRLLLAFGISFELPVVVFFLAFAGIVTHKQLIKFSRYFIVLAFFIAAIITPPDVMSQFLLAVPLIALYFLSILIAWMVQRKPAPAETP